MKTEEFLLLQGLKQKQLNHQGYSDGPDLVDLMLRDLAEDTKEKMKLRNICAFVSNDLFEQIEQIGQRLAISKRRMVEMALIDFADKAEKVISEHVEG